MDKRLRRAGWRELRHHPREALRLSLLARRHWRGVAETVEIGRRTSALAGMVKQALGDARVHAEARASAFELAQAARRAHRIGMTRALDDRQLARRLSRASGHAARALEAARRPRRPHHLRRAAALTAAGGVVGAASYAAWKARLRQGRQVAQPVPPPERGDESSPPTVC